jgi:excisionase family DNA binding protein
MNSPASRRLLTIGQMARRLGVPVKWLRAEAEAGRIPCLRAGERLLFVADVVVATLVERASCEVFTEATRQ